MSAESSLDVYHGAGQDHDSGKYLCPGESRSIDRAAHLGRLAAFYAPCRECVHRHDAQGLVGEQLRQRSEVERRGHDAVRFTAEELICPTPQALPGAMRQLAAAVATLLARAGSRGAPPDVLLGTLGHWNTAEAVAAACETLELFGCRAWEAGAVSSAALVHAARRLPADAALLVGNTSGQPHALAVKLWGAQGRPWSSPGELDRLAELFAARLQRPARRGGAIARASLARDYLERFVPRFHGLRPLRLVLDTTCQPLLELLGRLNRRAACEILPVESAFGGAVDAVSTFVDSRLAAVGRQVLAQGAHFGVWVDGDGERCHAVDERGRVVPPEALFLTLAGYIRRQTASAVVVVEDEAAAWLDEALRRRSVRAVRGNATRQAMCQRMAQSGALFAGGASGRCWYSGDDGQPAAPDALMTLSLLLSLLSQSDRPLSEVLDAP